MNLNLLNNLNDKMTLNPQTLNEFKNGIESIQNIINQTTSCSICLAERNGSLLIMSCDTHLVCYFCAHGYVDHQMTIEIRSTNDIRSCLNIQCPVCRPKPIKLDPKLSALRFPNIQYIDGLKQLQCNVTRLKKQFTSYEKKPNILKQQLLIKEVLEKRFKQFDQKINEKKNRQYICLFDKCFTSFLDPKPYQLHLRECGQSRFTCKRQNYLGLPCKQKYNPSIPYHYDEECKTFNCRKCLYHAGPYLSITRRQLTDHEVNEKLHHKIYSDMLKSLESIQRLSHQNDHFQYTENLIYIQQIFLSLVNRLTFRLTNTDSFNQTLKTIVSQLKLSNEDIHLLIHQQINELIVLTSSLLKEWNNLMTTRKANQKRRQLFDILTVVLKNCTGPPYNFENVLSIVNRAVSTASQLTDYEFDSQLSYNHNPSIENERFEPKLVELRELLDKISKYFYRNASIDEDRLSHDSNQLNDSNQSTAVGNIDDLIRNNLISPSERRNNEVEDAVSNQPTVVIPRFPRVIPPIRIPINSPSAERSSFSDRITSIVEELSRNDSNQNTNALIQRRVSRNNDDRVIGTTLSEWERQNLTGLREWSTPDATIIVESNDVSPNNTEISDETENSSSSDS